MITFTQATHPLEIHPEFVAFHATNAFIKGVTL